MRGGGSVTRKKKRLIVFAVIIVTVAAVWLFLQHIYPHFHAPFVPPDPPADLTDLLAKPDLQEADYHLLFAQTGLGKPAIDDLLALGDEGKAQILDTQTAFLNHPGEAPCTPLGITTREHRYLDTEGYALPMVPLAPLKNGDVLVTLSTHTAGWSHGHAGLVVDAERGVTLESVVLGSLSSQMNVNHWRSYSTLAVLRPKADEETRQKVVRLALDKLDNIPYSLVSGAFGEKFQPLDSAHSAHCGYLPWYAWMSTGIDLDSDGGRIAAPEDFLHSPNVEVVQVFGFDPTDFADGGH